MKEELVVKTIKIKRLHLETEDIEEALIAHFKLGDSVEFDWNIGQWVSLTITSREEEYK